MNWKLILQLSLFGLAMGIATVFLVSPVVEPVLWLAIFIVCAIVIAKRLPNKHFLHGLCVGIANSVWITASHIIFFNTYIANHAREASMMNSTSVSPKLMMAFTGPLVGIISGLVIGLFAFIAGKIVKRRAGASTES